MKVHPLSGRANMVIQYCIGDSSSAASHKTLRRLPHIFSRVLELPFRSDADVLVEENHDCFRFIVETENIGDVSARLIEIHPGVLKIVVCPNGCFGFASINELELDMWRFRLPESTRPELARAIFADGELIVTVPKEDHVDANEQQFSRGVGNSSSSNNNNNNSARLVLVQ